MVGERNGKIVQLVQREIVNHETGQVVRDERERVLRLPQEPEYVKLYMKDLAHVLNIPVGPQGVLLALIRKMDWEGIISVTAASRERIAASLGIKVHTVANYITVLCQHEILRRIGRGEYEVNPHLMAKGDWSEILKRRADFQLTVTYKPDGTKEVSGSVVPSNNSANDPEQSFG